MMMTSLMIAPARKKGNMARNERMRMRVMIQRVEMESDKKRVRSRHLEREAERAVIVNIDIPPVMKIPIQAIADQRKKSKKQKKNSKSSKSDKSATSTKESEQKNQFGKYGIIRESDLRTSNKVQRNFEIWLEEVKGVPQGTSVPKWEMTESFKEYAEDFNTVTLPHQKYYDYDKWEMEEYNRKKGRIN